MPEFPEEEEPTSPGGTEPAAVLINRIMVLCSSAERVRLARLCEAWVACDANHRALVEAIASELRSRA